MSVRADQRSESSLLFYKIARELRREISCDLLNKFNTKCVNQKKSCKKTLLKNTDKLYNKLFIEG